MSARVEDFIRTRLVSEPLAFRPDICLFGARPHSGLHRFLAEAGHEDTPPYWAYAWAGGIALALHLRDHPELVTSRSVLDFGAGSGLVGIAAALAGAARVIAFEPDAIGRVAAGLNAEANGVELDVVATPPTTVDIVLAGDVFYDTAVADLSLPLLEDYAAKGALVLVGDPFRRDLPLERLDLITEYLVPDMGGGALVRAGVFGLRPRTI